MKRWKFPLRSGVKFQDGKPCTPKEAASSLAPLFSGARQILADASSVTIQSAAPMPELLEELAGGRNFIFRAQGDGTLSGTGPFRLSSWPGSQADTAGVLRAVFTANDDAWSGRPFVDSIEVAMGVTATRQVVDLQLGRADVVTFAPDQVRRAKQAGLRTWSSAAVELVAVVLDSKAEAPDPRLGRAISLSIDRAAIVNVLLQRQGEAAGGLLPQWLSGYAFMFTTATDAERAKQLRSQLGSAARPLRLRVEGAAETARLVAERVAVNARQAGFSVQVTVRGDAGAPGSAPDAPSIPGSQLVRYQLRRVPAAAGPSAVGGFLGPGVGFGGAPEKIRGASPP